jgi:O-acetyl-ADP-ribose deacetylase (regulator of RNase III)
VYSPGEDRSELLASCYEQSLRAAAGLGAETVAFPAISAGAYGWPAEDAARIALTAVSASRAGLREARFVLFTPQLHATFARVLERLRQAGQSGH